MAAARKESIIVGQLKPVAESKPLSAGERNYLAYQELMNRANGF